MAAHSLAALNVASQADFAAALGAVYEHAPWVAEAVADQRPFASLASLAAAMRETVLSEGAERGQALLAGHPELAGAAVRGGTVAAYSAAEQAVAGLDRLSSAWSAEFDRLNAAYSERFGFPFILCVRRHGRDAILAEFRKRLACDPDSERATALAEVFRIAALRLDALVEGPDRLPVAGRLSTHVLDTHSGRPAAGLDVALVELSSEGERMVAQTRTNADGRTEAPLIGDGPVPRGVYELRFGLGDYFRERRVPLAEPAFLDIVPVRFAIAEPEGHYHVPLLATPWSYSVYRGS